MKIKIPREIENLTPIFERYPEVKLVYLFGSRATGKIGPLSDYDFAVYLDEKDAKKRLELRLKLIGEVTKVLKTDNVDLCILNDIDEPEIKYSIITDGMLMLEVEPFKVLVEPRILNEYFDFHSLLLRHNLTKA
ncbi:MAG: nucleotidyltransferase domain-containing protein [Patescibacteria group bacterium]